jgi:hypothetical protein
MQPSCWFVTNVVEDDIGPNSTIQTPLNGSFFLAIYAKAKYYHQNNVFSGSYPILLGIPTTLEYPRIWT